MHHHLRRPGRAGGASRVATTSRRTAYPLVIPAALLLTAHNNIESNVQVGSPQWNNEISGGGAKPHGGLQGGLGASPVPGVCGAGKVCQVAGLRAMLRAA